MVTWASGYEKSELYELDEKINIIFVTCKSKWIASYLKKRIRVFDSAKTQITRDSVNRKNAFINILKSVAKSLIINPYNTLYDVIMRNEYIVIKEKEYVNAIMKSPLENLLNDNNTILMTTSGPPVMHEIGNIIKNKYPNIFWIADYRDPILGNIIVKTTPKMKSANKKALINSNLLTTVSHGLADKLKKLSPDESSIIDDKVYILYNGFNSEKDDRVEVEASEKINKRIRIVYTGFIYPARRVDYLIHALATRELKNFFEFVYCGQSGALINNISYRENAGDTVINKGYISDEEAIYEKRKADILLLLKYEEDDIGVLTGKFFEYLEWNKPILVLGDKDPEFNHIAKRIGGIYIVPYDTQKIINRLHYFAENWPVEIKRNKIETDKFKWDNLAADFIKEVSKRKNKGNYTSFA